MRKTFLCLAVGALMASPALAEYGTITLDIKGSIDGGASWHDNLCLPECYTGDVLIQVYGSATTGGVEVIEGVPTPVQNTGVQSIYFDVLGSCMEGVQQVPMTLDFDWTNLYLGVPGYDGCGFTAVKAIGTGAVGQIAGVGASQGLPEEQPDGSFLKPAFGMPGAMTAAAAGAKGLPPVLMATGVVTTNGDCLEPCPTELQCPPDYVGCWIGTGGNGGFWKAEDNKIGGALVVDDQFWICTVPEPTTLILLVPALLGLRRRR